MRKRPEKVGKPETERKQGISIRSLLLVCNLSVMVVFLLLVVISNNRYRELVLEEFMERQRQTTVYIGDNLRQTVQAVTTLARATANNAAIVSSAKQYRAYGDEMTAFEKTAFLRNMDKNLSSAAFSREKIVSVNLLLEGLDASTTLVNSAYSYDDYFGDAPEKERVRGSAGVWLSTRKNNLPMHTYEPYILSYACRVYSDMLTGEPVGHLIINLDERLFRDEITRLNTEPTGTILLLDKEGRVLSGTDRTVLEQPLSATEYAFLDELLTEFPVGGARGDALVSADLVEDTGGWRIVSIADYREVILPLEQTSREVLRTGLVVLAGFSLLTVLLAFLLSRPIIQLSRHTGRIQQSADVFRRVPEESAITEIATLYAKYNDMMARLYRNEEEKRRKEFEVLEAQINPHFLYNTLESVNWMALSKGDVEISQVMIRLGNFLRLSLNKGRSIYRVRDEASHLQSYVDIQNIRSGGGVDYRCDIAEELLDLRMVKLLLQPLVENCILHGFDQREAAGTIRVTGRAAGTAREDLVFTVTDDGCGIQPERLAEILDPATESGHGIRNVEGRIKLYYGEQYGLSIDSEPGRGTVVTVRISACAPELPEVE